MKSLTESPAILTIHKGSPGQFILRITDLAHRPLLVGVTKLLPDAESFVVVTPSDIKVFAASTNGEGSTNETALADGLSTTGDAMPEAESAILDTEPEPQPSADPPAHPRVVRRKRPPSVAGHPETCGRCQGHGKVQMLLEGGASGEAACPVCKGTGTMTRYGARR